MQQAEARQARRGLNNQRDDPFAAAKTEDKDNEEDDEDDDGLGLDLIAQVQKDRASLRNSHLQ